MPPGPLSGALHALVYFSGIITPCEIDIQLWWPRYTCTYTSTPHTCCHPFFCSTIVDLFSMALWSLYHYLGSTLPDPICKVMTSGGCSISCWSPIQM